MKLAIVGSRSINTASIEALLKQYELEPELIITGGACGVDALAEQYAHSAGIPVKIFKPDYRAHSRRAPLIRNKIIARECDTLLALWDGKSRGTWHVAHFAAKIGKKVITHQMR